MKQLQWEKLASTESTVWGGAPIAESEWAARLREQGIFAEMENDFRAMQTVKRATPKKEALVSVLDHNARQKICASLTLGVRWQGC